MKEIIGTRKSEFVMEKTAKYRKSKFIVEETAGFRKLGAAAVTS